LEPEIVFPGSIRKDKFHSSLSSRSVVCPAST
jgi:hypothetical protein